MSKRYLERMSTRIAAGASDLVRLWNAKADLIGPGGGAFDADLDLQLATMVSRGFLSLIFLVSAWLMSIGGC